jgi:hypothetical protein
MSMPTISISLDRETYELLYKMAEERGLRLYDFVKEFLKSLAKSVHTTPIPPSVEERLSRLERTVSELKDTVEWLVDLHRREVEAKKAGGDGGSRT